jgi:spore germination protein YaaH
MAQLKYYKKNRLSTKWIIGGLLLAVLLISSSVFFLLYPFASKEKKEFFSGENPILFNGKQEGNALIEENTLYIPLTFIQKNIDKYAIYDEKSKSVIITTADKVVQMPTDSLTYFVNQKPVNIQLSPILSRNGQIYVAIDPIRTYYPIDYKKMAGSGAIWIQKDGQKYVNGQITSEDVNKERLRLRTKPTLQSPYTDQVNKKEAVMIEGEKDDFYLVRNSKGISGYIQKKYVNRKDAVQVKITRETPKFQTPKINGPVQLTWEGVYTKNPNPKDIQDMPGVNVVSPTWFSIAANDGTIKNLASLDYSNWAHSKGYQVWGLFSNSFNPQLTHEALKDFDTRQSMIRQLLNYSQMYQLQGINFDFENVKKEDGPLVTQFIKEAAPYLHEAGLVVSIDITFAAGENNNWSSFFERKDLGQIVDYVIVMAYDEHINAASGEGSVASLPWVEKNTEKLLTEVPNQKLILGVPLYSRLWKEQQNADGTTTITSKALSMDKVKAWLAEKGLTPTYDEKSGQNFAEFVATDEKATYKIWIEDELSLNKRAAIVEKYHLAGLGTWSRNFGDQTAWTALNLNTNKTVTQK